MEVILFLDIKIYCLSYSSKGNFDGKYGTIALLFWKDTTGCIYTTNGIYNSQPTCSEFNKRIGGYHWAKRLEWWLSFPRKEHIFLFR